MRFVSILIQIIIFFVAGPWILIRLAVRGCCEKYCDPGRSLWEYGQWVIAPKWPLLLAWTAWMLMWLTPSTDELAVAGWGSTSLFWIAIWAKSLRAFHPISKPDKTGYEDEPEFGA